MLSDIYPQCSAIKSTRKLSTNENRTNAIYSNFTDSFIINQGSTLVK